MKIMITGATGFIGNKLLKRLIKTGYDINVLCRPSSDISGLDGTGAKIYFGDICNRKNIEECMKDCQQVYHLAALAKNWTRRSSDYYKYNTTAVKNIMDSALKLDIEKVLFMSTGNTFGPSLVEPVNEKSIRFNLPFTIYEDSKIEAEKIAGEFADKGLHIVTINPTRLFGPGLLTEGNSVSKMVHLYLKGNFRFIPGNGNAVGNYTYIDDLVNGCINAMKKGRSGEKYILGGENISYNRFFEILSELSETKRYMFHLPESAAMVFGYLELMRAKVFFHHPVITPEWIKTFTSNWAFSSLKAINEIDYKITPFKQALTKTLEWVYSFDYKGKKQNEQIKFAEL
jgi:nucleoside-diphosphate-sugar epimerase